MIAKKSKFDLQRFLADLQISVDLLPQAEEIGFELATAGIRKIYLVGCGAPYYLFRVIAYWANLIGDSVEVKTLYPDELITFKNSFDNHTLVIFGSHSGTTLETVDAAEGLRLKFDQTLAITQSPDSLLGKNATAVLAYGESTQGYFSTFILAQMLISAILHKSSENWILHSSLKSSLPALPAALSSAKEMSFGKAYDLAAKLKDENKLYVVGTGPMYTTAYIFAACFLMEMQRLHAQPINGYDFFHGPFEVLDHTTTAILLMGEDGTRKNAERIRRFCDQHTGGCVLYDSRDFQMAGIDVHVRPLVAPFIVDAALTNLVEQLAVRREYPMDTRRYMGKVDY